MVKDRFAMQAKPSLRYFDGFSMKTLDNGYEVNFLQKPSFCSTVFLQKPSIFSKCWTSTKTEFLFSNVGFLREP